MKLVSSAAIAERPAEAAPPPPGGAASDCYLLSILIAEPDPGYAAAMRRAIVERSTDALVEPRFQVDQVHVAHSIETLLKARHEQYRFVICAMEHADGTGIDALSYLRHAQPTIGVLLYGFAIDEPLIREAILGGAIDLIECDQRFLEFLPLHISSALARIEAQEPLRQMKKRLHQAMGSMTDELARLQSRIDHLETLSVTDELTGLYNRRYMNLALDDFWKRARHDHETLGCMIIDIDRFKMLNDRFGHQSGDAALYILGQVLRENCRKTDIITRYGGDEFCVLMPDIDMPSAVDIAGRIDAAFRSAAAALLQEHEFRLGLSIGVSITSYSRPRTAMQLVAHADEAMYAAKREGHPVRARGEQGVLAA